MTYAAGWDYFSPTPGTQDKMYCRVCCTSMTATRNINGPTGSIEAMGGGKHLHDSFACPFSGEDWHCQVLALKIRMEKEICKKIYDMLESEMREVLQTKKVTIEKEWKYYWIS